MMYVIYNSVLAIVYEIYNRVIANSILMKVHNYVFSPSQHSPFFAEQLTAFQVWLTMGVENRNPPEQLPIVLQVQHASSHAELTSSLFYAFALYLSFSLKLSLSHTLPFFLSLPTLFLPPSHSPSLSLRFSLSQALLHHPPP